MTDLAGRPVHRSATEVGEPPHPVRAGPSGEAADVANSGHEQPDPRFVVWSERIARRLPGWMGSIRFRLTVTYSLFLFGLGAFVVAGIYFTVANRLSEQPVTQRLTVPVRVEMPDGSIVPFGEVRGQYTSVERLANERALRLLGSYSLGALGLMFLASLGIGWVVAGRVLSPIGAITEVAQEIQVTDLSRRIGLRGPPDELRKMADTFDAMLERLDQAFEGQSRFIQEASHELRNPLAVIRTNLDVVLTDPDASVEDLRHTGALVNRTAERMSRLVDDLLAYAHRGAPERGQGPVEVAGVVTDAASEFEVLAEARGLRLEASATPGLWVHGDRIALRQAVTNLVANAVRLAPTGTGVRIASGRDGGWVWMAVEDQGPGIPEAEHDLVFQRFWSGDKRRSREEGRSGLGLAIVRQIAETHRGQVRLLASPGGGSTFVIWLPAADPPEVAPPVTGETPALTDPRSS